MRKQIEAYAVVLGLAIILCAAMTYFLGKQNSYGEMDILVKGSYYQSMLSRETIEAVEGTLTQIAPPEYEQQALRLQEEYQAVNRYRQVLQLKQKDKGYFIDELGHVFTIQPEERDEVLEQYDYTLQQSEEHLTELTACIDCLRQAMEYREYVEQIHLQAERMVNSSVFSESSKKAISKTDRDFYGRENIQVTATTGVGLKRLFTTKIGVMFCALSALACAWISTVGRRTWNRNTFGYVEHSRVFPFLVVIGFCGIYTAEALGCNLAWKLESLDMPIQSLTRYRSSHFMLSVSALLVIQVLFKVLGDLILYFFFEGILSMEKKWQALVVLGITGLVGIGLAMIEKALNPLILFQMAEIIGIYRNVNILGIPVTALGFSVALAVILLIASYVFASRQMARAGIALKEEAEKQYFENIDTKYNEIRMMRHDMNNHLATISYLLTQGRTEEALHFVQEISSELELTKTFAGTGRNTLDALLSNKITAAQQVNVKLVVDWGADLSDSDMTDYELCALLGNLIDNAVEATSKYNENREVREKTAKCMESETTAQCIKNSEVQVKVRRQMDMLCIFVENPYLSVQEENGRFVTQKTDKRNHGLGLKQVERIAHKYRGNLSIQTEDNIFAVSVLLNDRKGEP